MPAQYDVGGYNEGLYDTEGTVARTTLTPLSVAGPYPVLPVVADSLDFAFAAADNTNGNDFIITGKELLLVQNSDSSAHTFTATSVPDQLNRTGDITTYSMAAGEFAAFSFSNIAGWKQADGKVWLAANSNLIKFAVLRLP